MRSLPALTLLLAAALCLGACNRSADSSGEDTDPLQLRQYSTPAGKSEAVASALNDVLAGSEHQAATGKASSRVDGQVVVLAPLSMQASIERTIKSLVQGGTPSGAVAPASVRMNYWLIDTLSGEGEDDPALTDVREALTALRPNLGAVHFRLNDRVTLVSGHHHGRAEVTSGRGTRVKQYLDTRGDGLLAQIDILQLIGPSEHERREASVRLEVEATLKLSETVLLAQVNAEASADAAQKLVLVRAEAVGAP